MSYVRFAAMITVSTVVMFGLMYVHTHAWDDVYFSETRAWMALLMGAMMTMVMLAAMWKMYANETLKLAIMVGALLTLALCTWLIRSQVTISGSDYLKAMVPHHSIAVLTSTRANIEDPRVRKLADEIIESQRKEIAEMKYLIRVLKRDGVQQGRTSRPAAETLSAAEAVRTADLATTDLEPMADAELKSVLGASATCRFSYAADEAPVAVATTTGEVRGLIKLHGRLVPMTVRYAAAPEQGFELSGDDVEVVTTPRSDAAGGGSRDAEATFRVGADLAVGYAGFYHCRE